MTDRRSISRGGSAGTDASSDAALGLKIAALVSAGVDWVQIREKDLAGRELSGIAHEALRAAASHTEAEDSATRIVINDRLDVALTVGANGVHLGESGLPVRDAKILMEKRIASKVFFIGVSCHSTEAVRAAAEDGADYIFFGPVFATPSKAIFGAPQGIERLAEACRAVSVPVLAIGGITVENAGECVAAGASGIAAIRLFQDAENPAATIQALRKIRR